MKDHRQQIKEIKEGVINKKLESKPSFKNLFDIKKEKIPGKDRSPRGTNRSRSISQKKTSSQQKIGTVQKKITRENRLSRLSAQKSQTSINAENQQKINSEPFIQEKVQKKSAVHSRQSNEQSNNFRRYQTQKPEQLYEESKISTYRYATDKSQASPKHSKGRSTKKSVSKHKRKEQQIFKMIINMKNDINRLEKIIQNQESQIKKRFNPNTHERDQKNSRSKNKNRRKPINWQTIDKLKKTKSFLMDYSDQISCQTSQIGQSYLTKLQQFQKTQQNQQQNYQLPFPKIKEDNCSPGMPELQKKLRMVSRLLI